MRKLILFFIVILTLNGEAQKFYTDLYGFRLGQRRESTRNELGKPFQSGKFEDGYTYEAFLLKPDSSLHIIFEYTDKDSISIWSIQVSGSNYTSDIGFNHAKLGIDKSQTEKLFGKPSEKKEIGDYGYQWNYEKSNFSFEINPKGKLSSVKLEDISSELFETPDFKKIPTFEQIQKILSSPNNADIFNILSGDVEIYKNDSTYYFKKSFGTEQSTDYSKIISLNSAACSNNNFFEASFIS